MPRVLPEVPPASASTAEPPAPALNTPKPIPPVDEKLRAPTPKPPGLKDTPPTPATLPLVAEAMPPTATGGTVARVKLKGVGFEPACAAPMMVLLKAVVFPSTSSFDAGAAVPIPTLPACVHRITSVGTNELPCSVSISTFSPRITNPTFARSNICTRPVLAGSAFPTKLKSLLKFIPSPTVIRLPSSEIEELITFAPVPSNLVTTLGLPPPPIVAAPVAGLGMELTTTPPPNEGLVSTKEDSGFPPNVSASAAFNA